MRQDEDAYLINGGGRTSCASGGTVNGGVAETGVGEHDDDGHDYYHVRVG